MLQALSTYFPSSTKLDPTPEADAVLRWLEDKCTVTFTADGIIKTFRAPSLALRPAMTTFLVGYVAEHLCPQLVMLHGNALLGRSGKPVLLLGESGSGKSTLTALLTERHGWKHMAEDLVAIDPAKKLAYGFPRAAALRETEEPESVPHWQEYSAANPTRFLANTLASDAPPFFSIEEAEVIFLERLRTSSPARNEGGGSVWWFSHLGEDAITELRELLPPFRLDQHPHCTGLRFDLILNEKDTESLVTLSEKHCGLLLRIDNGGGAPTGRPVPFTEPSLRVLTAGEALPYLRRHRRVFSAPAAEAPNHKLFTLLRAFSAATMKELQVGGSAEQCVALVDGGHS